MKLIFSILLSLIALGVELHAQCNEPAPPSLTCGEAGQPENVLCTLDGYCSTSNSDPNTQNVPSSFCGSVENNVWLAFVAGSTQLQIAILVENCNNGDGLQAQIYADCQGFNPVSNCWNPGSMTNGILTATNLTIGNTYYLMIDGWAGDYCDFTLEEISGSTSPPEPADPNQINGPLEVCPGAIVTYCVPSSFGASFYSWEVPAGATIIAGQDSDCITVDWGDSPGGDVCVIAANSCNSSNPFCITVEMGPPPSSTLDAEVCEEDLPYLFNGLTLTASGQYTAVLTNALGCDSTITLNLEVISPEPTFIEATICEGETYTLGNLEFSQSGNYPLTFQNAQGCDSLVELTLTVLVSNTLVAAPGTISCFLPTVTLDGSLSTAGPNIFYLWETLDGLICSDPTLPFVAVCAGGTYTLTVTNSLNGVECVSSASVTVQEDLAPPAIEIDYPGTINCVDDCVTLETSYSDAGSNVIISWAGPDNFYSAELSPTVCLPGVYSITMINMDNGCSGSLSTTVVDDQDYPEANAGGDLTLDCANPFVLADGTASSSGPGFSYNWVAPNGSSVSNEITAQLNAPGQYILEVVNTNNGCVAMDTMLVTVDNVLPLANAGNDKIINCYVPSAFLNGNGSTNNGNTVFEWSFGGTVLGNTINLSVNEPGTYLLTVTDTTNGCASTDQVQVVEDTGLPTAQANVSGFLDCITGSVTLDATGSFSLSDNTGYLWETLSGQLIGTGFSFTVTDPGYYVLNVTDLDNGCEDRDTIEVLIDQNTPYSEPGPAGVLTCTIDTWTLSPGNSSSGPDMSFQWLDPEGNPLSQDSVIEVDIPGNYILVVSNSTNGCTAEGSVFVAQDTSNPLVEAGIPQTLTCTDTVLELDGSGSSEGPIFSYGWTDSAGNLVGDSLITAVQNPGTYILQVTNEVNGCTSTDSVLLLQDVAPPEAAAGSDQALTCTVIDVQLDAGGSSGGSNLAFIWKNGNGDVVGNTSVIQVSSPDFYSLVVVNTENGCQDVDTAEVYLNAAFPEAVAGPDSLLNCSVTQIVLDGSASTGVGLLSYEWQSDAGPIGSESMVTVSDSGTYSLLVTDTDNGCTATDQVYIGQDVIAPIAVAGPNGMLTCTSSSVLLDGNGSSEGPGFVYEWLNQGGVTVSTSIQATVGETGTYTLIVTDTDNGCSATAQTEVMPDSDLPLATAGVSGILTCSQVSVDLSAAGSTSGPGIAYIWKDPQGQGIGNGVSVPVQAPGIYSLTVENTLNGCASSATVAVNQNISAPGVDPGMPDTLTCANPAIQLAGNGNGGGAPLAFNWYDLSGNLLAGTDTLTVEQPGTYFLEITNLVNGCVADDSVLIAENTQIPSASILSGGTLTCANPTFLLDGSDSDESPVIIYEWFDGAGQLVGSDWQLVIDEPDTYTLKVTDTQNGCTSAEAVEVDEDVVLPIADAGEPFTLTCAETSTIIGSSFTSTGLDFGYEWADETGSLVGVTATIEVTTPGLYTLQVTNTQNGCTADSQVEITRDTVAPIANAGDDAALTCYDPVFELIGNQGNNNVDLAFAWYDASGNLLSATDNYSTAEPGVYNLLVTDVVNGCTSTDEAVVLANNTPPVVLANVSNVLTCAEPEALLYAGNSTSTNGAPLAYLWLDGTGNQLIQLDSLLVTEPGTYEVEVLDTENGCISEGAVQVVQNTALPIVAIETPETLNCVTDSVLLDGTNSQGADLHFAWYDTNGVLIQEDSSVYAGAPGIYQLIVTDGVNGCTSSGNMAVDQDVQVPIAAGQPSGIITCSNPVVELDGSESSQGTLFNYEWLDSQGGLAGNGAVVEVSVPGNYSLEVTNSNNGCTAVTSIEVLIDTTPPQLELFANPSPLLTCFLGETELDGSGSTGIGLISYKWLNSAGVSLGNLPWLDVNAPDTYTLIVSASGNGCKTAGDIQVLQDIEVPNNVILPPDTLNCQVLETLLDGSGSSVGPEFDYQWTQAGVGFIGNTPQVSVSTPGSYALLVTNLSNGCSQIGNVTVQQDVETPTPLATVSGILTCDQESVTLDGGQSIGGINPGYTWNLDGQVVSTNPSTNISVPGMYELEVTNLDNFCSASVSQWVAQDTVHPVAKASVTAVLTCENESVNLESVGSSTGSTIDYTWVNSSQMTIGTGMTETISLSGNYALVVANNQNGCADTAFVTVLQDTISPIAVAQADAVLTCVQTEVTLSSTGSSAGSFSYNWFAIDGITLLGTGNDVTVQEPGTYTLLVTDDFSGCTSAVTVLVEQNIEDPVAHIDSVGPFLITCDNPNVELDASASSPVGTVSFQWTFQNNQVGTNSAFSATEPGQYTLVVTNTTNGCTAGTAILVSEDTELPYVSIDNPGILTCLETSVPLDGSASSAGANFSYGWSGPLVLSGGAGQVALAGGAGTYTLEVTNTETGCTNAAFVSVEEDVIQPVANAVLDHPIDCFDPEAEVAASGSSTGGNFSYAWTTDDGNLLSGANSFVATVNAAGTYILVVTNEMNGCTAQSAVMVEAFTDAPVDAEIALVNPSCYGFQNGSIIIETVYGGTAPYVYSLDNSPYIAGSAAFGGLTAGDYQVTVQDVYGCEWSTVVSIIQPDELIVELGDDRIINLGDEAFLEALVNRFDSDLSEVAWTYTKDTLCSGAIASECRQLVDTPFLSTNYLVTVTDINGCSASDRIRILVNKPDRVFIPSAFSPDGDGENDFLTVYGGKDVRQIRQFTVVNRWGEEVHRAENFLPGNRDAGWQGTFRGQPENPAVFVAWAEVEFIDGTVEIFTRDVTLVR